MSPSGRAIAASRLGSVKASASAGVSQHARALAAAGQDVIDLGLGEPDFDTPAHIIEAAHAAALAGQTRYPPTEGTAALRQAVVDKLQRDNALSYQREDVFVSNGAKQVIFAALMATLEADDEVLLVAPYFDSYENIIRVLGGQATAIPTQASDQFRLDPAELDKAISARTRWLILNTPSNPAGAWYSTEQLQQLGDVLARHPDVLILSDEIYEHIIFDQRRFVSFAAACPSLRQRILTVNGVSKAYAMTGWRIGYAAGDLPLIKAMTKMQSQISSGACSIAQAAAAAALNGSQQCLHDFRTAFERRRNLVTTQLSQIDTLTLDPPAGAFYALIGCSALIGARGVDGQVINSDTELAEYLLEQAKVALVPGIAYGQSPYIRLSTACADEKLEQALQRIGDAVSQLTLADNQTHTGARSDH